MRVARSGVDPGRERRGVRYERGGDASRPGGHLLRAEHRRVAQAVTPADQQSRDVAVRRAAARALARVGGEAARPGLLRALADEDEEVVAWGAYGLGFGATCKGHERETASALIAQGLALTRSAPGRAGGPASSTRSRPSFARWAAAAPRSRSPRSSPGSRGAPERAAAAAASRSGISPPPGRSSAKKTLAALLNLAAGSASTPAGAGGALPRRPAGARPLTVVERIHEVATARLAAPGDARLFAVRALGRADEGAAAELARVLTTPGSFNAAERAEAARGLKRLGPGGQRALAAALPQLVPPSDPVALTALVSDELGVVLTVLESLTDPSPARKALAELASIPRRPARRPRSCAASRSSAATPPRPSPAPPIGTSSSPTATSPAGAASARAPWSRSSARPPSSARASSRTASALREGDLRAREAALELLEKHDEVQGAAALLTEALAAKESGLVSTAAEVLAKQPQRAVDERAPAPRKGKRRPTRKRIDIDNTTAVVEPPAPSPALVKALLDALARPAAETDPESATALLDAVGALALKAATPRLEDLCRSSYPTTREHAAKALGLVGAEKKTLTPRRREPPPAELDHLVHAPVTLSFDTDAGALTLALDPSLAPVMVTRVADLARARLLRRPPRAPRGPRLRRPVRRPLRRRLRRP